MAHVVRDELVDPREAACTYRKELDPHGTIHLFHNRTDLSYITPSLALLLSDFYFTKKAPKLASDSHSFGTQRIRCVILHTYLAVGLLAPGAGARRR